MSNNVLDFKGGVYFYTEQDESRFFHEFKKILRKLHVSYIDDCCEDEYCPDTSPCFTLENNAFVYHQEAADTLWTIEHNLGFNPNVQVIADGGTNVIGTIDYIDENNLTIEFNTEYAGYAYLS